MNIGLGTVQFGRKYGVANKTGRVPLPCAREILRAAASAGVELFDTAAGYGAAESVLGCGLAKIPGRFRITTKTPAFMKNRIGKEDVAELRVVFLRSLVRLRTTGVFGLLFHNAGDLLTTGGELLYAETRRLQKEGLVQKIGLSVYSPQEAKRALAAYDFDLIQFPLNVFDQRMLEVGLLRCWKKRGLELHARSVFLQGLLLMPLKNVPPYFAPLRTNLRRWHAALRQRKLSPLEGAILFVRQIRELDAAFFGVLNTRQLRDILAAFARNVGTTLDCDSFAVERLDMINPVLWKLR